MLNSSQNVAASIMCFYTATPLATDGQQNRRRRACRGAQARPSGKQPSETRSGESAATAVWRAPRAVRSTWTYAGPRSSGASGFGDFCRNIKSLAAEGREISFITLLPPQGRDGQALTFPLKGGGNSWEPTAVGIQLSRTQPAPTRHKTARGYDPSSFKMPALASSAFRAAATPSS